MRRRQQVVKIMVVDNLCPSTGVRRCAHRDGPREDLCGLNSGFDYGSMDAVIASGSLYA